MAHNRLSTTVFPHHPISLPHIEKVQTKTKKEKCRVERAFGKYKSKKENTHELYMISYYRIAMREGMKSSKYFH